jgi:Cys-rich protein (TIGR01571 family)
MGASLSVAHAGSRSVSGLQQVNSFQNTSESVGSFAPPMSNARLPPTPVSPTKRPPLAPSSESDNRALRNLEEQHKRLRAREVELHENASVASVLTSPSIEQQHAATSESLARKQLLAELREASTLMAESQTPEAAEFWKNHVISLQARLRSLHNETDSENMRPISPPRRPPSKTSPRIEHHRSVPKNTKEELLSTPNYGPPKYSTEFFHPPLEASEPKPREMNQLSYAQQQSGRNSPFVDKRRSSPYLGAAPPPLEPAMMKNSDGIDPAKHLSTGSGADRVDVVSPADLPAGYQFEAEIDGHRFLATVPFGGAKRGETFSCVMRELTPSGPSVPTGAWRDRLCDCTKFGTCHPVNLNTIFCPLLSLGQVMTRLKLDAFGRPTKLGGNTWSTMWTITIFWIAMNVIIYMAFNFKWVHHLPLTIPDYIAVTALNVAGIAFTLYAVAATRAAAREIYHIREYRFYDLEDNCCATFCTPCTICQLHRHTVPYDQLEAKACTKTGLDPDVRLDFIKTHALH